MKKISLLIGLMILMSQLVMSSLADDAVKAKKFRKFTVHEQHEVNWTLKYGETGTSDTFLSNGVMTLFGVAYDGVNGDSAHFKLHLDVKGVDGWNNSVKTKTIESDSTEFTWELTATYIPSRDSLRVRAEAITDCRKLDNIIIKLEYSGCEAAMNY